jgi:hypothetical protein
MLGVYKLNNLSSHERRVLEARMLADQPMMLEELATEFGALPACACGRLKPVPLRRWDTERKDRRRPR